MSGYIKTTKSWKRHLPQKPKRVQRGYYTQQKSLQQKKIIRIIFLIFIILLFQGIFQIPYLRINQIKISGHNDLSSDEVQNLLSHYLNQSRFLIFKNSNYFLLNTQILDELLLQKYNLEEIKVNKQFPDKLQVVIKEKVSHFIWQKDDSLYLIGAKGVLNRQISVLDDKYLILLDKRDYRPIDEQIFSADEINIINQIYLNWNDKLSSKVRLKQITINSDWNLELQTDIGFGVRLDAKQDVVKQLNSLLVVLSENITGVDIDYIDLRFGDQVYFK